MNKLEKPMKLIEPEYEEVKFTIPGEPKGKQRPRVVSKGGFARAYTPKETVNYENLVALSYQVQVGEKKIHGPIDATIIAYFSIPNSISNKKKEMLKTETIPHIKKPDIDNIVKAISDGCNKIAFDDDSQIYNLTASKYYSENPRVEVILKTQKET